MKIARINSNIIEEIIPSYALPVEKWYGENFASLCEEVPDEAQVGWIKKEGIWIENIIPNSEIREYEYEHRKCIEWNGEMLTIDEANKMYWEYMIENRTDITDELQAKIIAAKQAIREEYPDEQ